MKNRMAKTMKRRFMSLLLALAMIVTMMPATEVQAAEATVDLGDPAYVTGSTTDVSFNDVTIVDGGKTIYTVVVTVDSGAIQWKDNDIPTMTDRDAEHKTAVWIKPGGWVANDIVTLIKNLTFKYTAGTEMKVNVTVDTNAVEGDFANATITKNNIVAANGHYYMYVPYDPSEMTLDDTQKWQPNVEGTGYENPTWIQAYNKAKGYRFMGMSGYLATIADKAEIELLHSIYNRAAWCGATLLVQTTDNEKIHDPDSIGIDTLKVYDGDDVSQTPEKDKVDKNRELAYWACGPEAGQTVSGLLWDEKEPNYNDNPYNSSMSTSTLAAYQGNETCIIANYQNKSVLNDIREGNYADNNPDRPNALDARAFGYFVEFGGYNSDHPDGATKEVTLDFLELTGKVTNGLFDDNGQTSDEINETINAGDSYTIKVTANEGFTVPDAVKEYNENVIVKVGGNVLNTSQYSWVTHDTGGNPYGAEEATLTILDGAVTDKVEIEVNCIQDPPYKVTALVKDETGTITIGSKTNVKEITEADNITATYETDVEATLKAEVGYEFHVDDNFKVTIAGEEVLPGGAYMVTPTGGGSEIQVTIYGNYIIGDVHIEAKATPKELDVTGTATNATFEGDGAKGDELNDQGGAQYGTDYTTKVIPDPGYEVSEDDITITVTDENGVETPLGQNDFEYDENGNITIPGEKVTGNINIVVEADLKDLTLTGDVTGGTFTSDDAKHIEKKITAKSEYNNIIEADKGYKLPTSITVKVGTTTLDADKYNYNPDTGEITIPGDQVTDDVVIKADCVPENHDVTGKVEGGTFVDNGGATLGNTLDVKGGATTGTPYTATVKADEGYTLPTDKSGITVTVGGVPTTDFTYYPNTGEIVVNGAAITDDVHIQVECVPDDHKLTGNVNNGTFGGQVSTIDKTIKTGEGYTTTITPDEGYKLPDTITVKVGNTPLDADKYNYNPDTGEITIPGDQVTDDVEITAVCVPESHDVTGKVEGGTFVDNGGATLGNTLDVKGGATTGTPYTATVKADEGYTLPTDKNGITVTVGGVPTTDFEYDSQTGKIIVNGAAITGNVDIKVKCTPKEYKLTGNVNNGVFEGKTSKIEENIKHGQEYTTTITPGTGYNRPESITVTVGDKTLTPGTDYTYDPTTGKVTIPGSQVTGDVKIDATCTPKDLKVDGTVTGGTFAGKGNTISETTKTGTEYTTTITPDDGYNLPGSVVVAVGGKTLTPGTDYTYDTTTGKITIPGSSVNGDIVIKGDCTKKEDTIYKVTSDVKHGEFEGEKTVKPGEDYEATITPDDGYKLPDDIKIVVGGKTLSEDDYDWDPETGDISIPDSSVTGDIKITAKCTKDTYDVEDDIKNGKFKGDSEVEDGEDYKATITPDDGYKLPDDITITVDGDKIDSSDYTWDPKTGKLTIDGSAVTGDIKIIAKCTKTSSGGSGNGSGSSSGSSTGSTTTSATPKTGDEMNIILYAALMILAMGGFAGCAIGKFKNREPKNN